MGSTVLAVLAFGVGALMAAATVLSADHDPGRAEGAPGEDHVAGVTGMRALVRLRRSRARSFEARGQDLAL